MLINREANWIILTPPKTGSTTLSKTFSWLYSGHQHDTTIPADFTGTIYATVRNPFGRAVSFWRHWLWDRVRAEHVRNPTELADRTEFRNFCAALPSLGSFFYPMSWWTRKVGTVVPLRLENLDEEVRRFNLLDKGCPLPKLNCTHHEPFETYYTPDLQEHISTFFAHDFSVFDYSRVLPSPTGTPG